MLNGTCRTAVRIGAGVVDAVTFPFPAPDPDYGPLVNPEFPPDLMDV